MNWLAQFIENEILVQQNYKSWMYVIFSKKDFIYKLEYSEFLDMTVLSISLSLSLTGDGIFHN